MQDAAANLLRRLGAIAILAVAAWLVLKVFIGLVAAVAWAVTAVVVVVAVVWALRQL